MINLTFVTPPAVAHAALASILDLGPWASRKRGGQPVEVGYEAFELEAAAGASLKQAAVAAGLSYATAKRRLLDDSRFAQIWAARSKRERTPSCPPAAIQPDRIRALAAAGLNKVEAAAKISISPYVFGWWLRREPSLGRAWNEGKAAFLTRPAETTTSAVRRRPGRPATKPLPRPASQNRPADVALDPVAVRALAGAGMGQGRAAAAMGVSLRRLAKALEAESEIREAWDYGRLDRWRRNPQVKVRPRAPAGAV